MAETKFEAGKEYTTRDGRRAKVFMTDGADGRPIIGAVYGGDYWGAVAWDAGGFYYSYRDESGLDITTPVPVKHTRWVNIYRPNQSVVELLETREAADKKSGGDRIACIQITYHEGEGL